MVEYTDSREASTYYGNLLGANMPPSGIMRPVRADVDFGPYMADLQRRIKAAWHPPKGNESKRVVVVFKVHRDGSLSNLRIDHSSGVAVCDQYIPFFLTTDTAIGDCPLKAEFELQKRTRCHRTISSRRDHLFIRAC